MKRIALIIFFMAAIIAPYSMQAQIVSGDSERFNPDSIRRDFKNQPYFGLYKDNYFIFGPPVGPKPTKENTNIKFQISIAQRLTNATLPGGTYLYLFYSQKCFWNVLENSMPMTDLNFNPGIGITKPLFVKNRYVGKLSLILEHESNGRDSIWSRSWNKVSLAANIIVDPHLSVAGKVWIPDYRRPEQPRHPALLRPIPDLGAGKQHQPQVLGFAHAGEASGQLLQLQYHTRTCLPLLAQEQPISFPAILQRLRRGLLDYKVWKSQVRIGIVIKPQLFSDF